MTKTLTEQWRNEELPIDLYYIIDKLGRETIGNDCGIRDMMVDAFNGGNIFIKEVLSPVPSYDEYQKLQEQLNEANEVIKKYMTLGNWYDFYNEGPGMVADDMQKYLEKWGVK